MNEKYEKYEFCLLFILRYNNCTKAFSKRTVTNYYFDKQGGVVFELNFIQHLNKTGGEQREVILRRKDDAQN